MEACFDETNVRELEADAGLVSPTRPRPAGYSTTVTSAAGPRTVEASGLAFA
jgi:hypothetical protein